MKVIENKDCRVITTTQQGLVLVEDSGVIIQIDQQVILRAAENLGLFNYYIVREPDEVEKADETIKQLKSSLANKQTIVSKHLKKIEEQEQLLKEKDATIETLRKDIADGNKLINELESQRNDARDISKEHKSTIETLSKTIQNYENTGKYIQRYTLINNYTVVFDNALEHEPIVCADAKSAKSAIRSLNEGNDWNETFKFYNVSKYRRVFYSNSNYTKIIDNSTKQYVDISNSTIASILYIQLECGNIKIDDIIKMFNK